MKKSPKDRPPNFRYDINAVNRLIGNITYYLSEVRGESGYYVDYVIRYPKVYKSPNLCIEKRLRLHPDDVVRYTKMSNRKMENVEFCEWQTCDDIEGFTDIIAKLYED